MKINFEELKKETKQLCKKIPKKYKYVFGIPCGGLIPAYIVSDFLNVPLLSIKDYQKIKNKNKVLVVDDLLDSGKTISKYSKSDKAVVFYKTNSNLKLVNYFQKEVPNEWLDLPHEKDDTEIENHIARIIEYLGEDINREGLRETPKRVIRSYDRLFEGYKKDFNFTVFENESKIDQIVGLSNIEFFSTCEHHLLPFFGKGHIFYIPGKKIVGISKLARTLDMFARRLQNQERIAKQVADFLEEKLNPKGIAVILEAQHFCMIARGVEKKYAKMKTSELRGVFRDNAVARQELFSLIK